MAARRDSLRTYQRLATLADQTADASGDSQDERVRRHILGDHGAGANHGELPDGDAGHDHCPRPQGGTLLHESG